MSHHHEQHHSDPFFLGKCPWTYLAKEEMEKGIEESQPDIVFHIKYLILQLFFHHLKKTTVT